MKRNQLIIIGSILGVLILVVGYVLMRDDSKTRNAERDLLSSQKDPTVTPVGPEGIPIVNEDPREVLDRYVKWSQYPPHSRPLHAGMVDLIDPYNMDRPPVGVIQSPAQGCTMNDGIPRCDKPAVFSDVNCKMTPQASISVGKGDFKVTLRCFNKEGVNVALSSIVPKVYRNLHRKDYPTLPPVAYGDKGTDGDDKASDNIYTFLIRPTQQDWGDLFLEVDFEVNGLKHNQRTSWFSTPQVIAEFRDGAQDSIRNGHLVVTVPVTIHKKGYYTFDANLQSQAGSKDFVSSSSVEGDFEAGARTIEFQFWGKVIRDTGADGPYVVREIRGRRNNSPVTPSMVRKAMEENREISGNHTEPLWEYMAPGANHVTRSYTSDEFSKEEWNSDEKQQRIEFLKKQIEQE
ncbi:MAG: hypothetical protein K8S54_18440 [Spirochaetia bacterium]|nr:hypothetical protein [Spirochaetia bacterium]